MSSELWGNDPEFQKRYEQVVANIRRLQAELGITPRTLEQRHQDYLARKAEEQRIEQELKRIGAIPRPKINFKRQ